MSVGTVLSNFYKMRGMGASREGPKVLCPPPPPQAEIWVAKLFLVAPAPQQTCKKKICVVHSINICYAFITTSVNLMLIFYVREIEINIRSFNCLVHLRHPWSTFCAINVSYYQKCSQTMKCKGRSNLIWTGNNF